jgi:acyl dehydratase
MAERSFDTPPSTPLMFARAAAALVPGASALPFVAGGGKTLPSLVLTMDDVATDLDRLAAYNRVCGFDLRAELPASYPHMLVFPLHLALMTDGKFPFAAVGLVHIANMIRQHRPIQTSEKLSLRVWADDLRDHPKGLQFSVVSQARAGDELVWEEVSTNLRRGGSDSSDGTSREDDVEIPAAATWKLPADLGRRYAAVSGDANPIHMHSLSAKAFGFKSAIAHGMWTKARCLAALGSSLPGSYEVSVEFKRPIFLPATVSFGEAAGGGAVTRFAVRDGKRGTPHLDGSVTPR